MLDCTTDHMVYMGLKKTKFPANFNISAAFFVYLVFFYDRKGSVWG